MLGMMQVVVYMLAFYFVLKGVEILQIGLASGRTDRKALIIIGAISIAVCAAAAFGFVKMGDDQARASSSNVSPYGN